MALLRCKVVGAIPIRDAITKAAILTGGEVVLDDSPGGWKGGQKRGVGQDGGKLAGTLIAPLVEAGCIEVLGPYVEPAAKPAKAEG